MPYADRAKQNNAEKESKKRIYSDMFSVKIRADSGISPYLHAAAENAEISLAQYMIIAAREKLIRDGYMPAPDDEGEPSV